jgi:ATP-binding cassette subfamily B protein
MSVAIAFAITAAACTLITPVAVGAAVDDASRLMRTHAISGADMAGLAALATLVVVGNLARGVATFVYATQAEIIGRRVAFDLQVAFFDKVQRLDAAYHDRTHPSDLIVRGMIDIDGARLFVEASLLRGFMLATLFLFAVVQMLALDAVLGVIGFAFLLFASWRLAALGRRLLGLYLAQQTTLSHIHRTIHENLEAVRIVRSFAAAEHEIDKYDAFSNDGLALATYTTTLRSRSARMVELVFYVALGLGLFVGAQRVADGAMTLGSLAQFVTCMTIVSAVVGQVGTSSSAATRAAACAARLFEVLDTPSDVDAASRPPVQSPVETIEFEGVTFAYDGAQRPTIADLSFKISRGRSLGIVGAPGSGKTTVAQLLAGAYPPTAGRICFGEQDLRALAPTSVRRAVSIVRQDAFLFNTTVRENIAYANPGASFDEIVDAARSAQIDDYLDKIPNGYETVVGERGSTLSGGQRQRLSIARALSSAPQVLVLDDSTAALDAETEERLIRGLIAASAERILVVISHRLTSVMHADEILVMQDGLVAERGTHASLLARRGAYAALHQLQTTQLSPGHAPAQVAT